MIIPSTVEYISASFEGCTGLTGISIPAKVDYLGSDAFLGCTAVNRIDVYWTKAPMYRSGMLPAGKTVYVPAGTKSSYEAKAGWKENHTIVSR